jgi:hypothetical protein
VHGVCKTKKHDEATIIFALSFDSKLPFSLQQETKGKLLDQGNKARRKNLVKMI